MYCYIYILLVLYNSRNSLEMHFCFFIQTNVRIIDFIRIKIGLKFHKIFKNSTFIFKFKCSYEIQSKQILNYVCCEGEKWKFFDFFSPVGIKYLHENIQGKEVKNGNFSAKFKKIANCKKKFLQNNYKIISIIFEQNYFFFNKLLFPPEYSENSLST